MSAQVYKYPLMNGPHASEYQLPEGSEILHISMQHGLL